MAQGVLGFKYEAEKHDTGMTGMAGLPVYLDLMHAMGLPELIGSHLQVKQRGWTDAQMVLSLMLLNMAGGDCVEDLSGVGARRAGGAYPRRVLHFGICRRSTIRIRRASARKVRHSFLFRMSIYGAWRR